MKRSTSGYSSGGSSGGSPRPSINPSSPQLRPTATPPPPSPRKRQGSVQSYDRAAKGRATAVFGLAFVPNLALAYALIKPIRYTLAFWLPYYLRKELNFPEVTVAYLLMASDAAGIVGGMGFSIALDRFFLGQLFVPLAGVLAVLLLTLGSLGGAGIAANGVAVVAIGTVFSGLELIGSGATAGCVTETVGGSQSATLPAICSLVNGCGSVGSLVAVMFVSALVEVIGWRGLFRSAALSAVVAGCLLIPTMTRAGSTPHARRMKLKAD